MNPAVATLLEKAAVDNGFDLDLGARGDWLAFGSSQVGLEIRLTVQSDACVAALSQAHVAGALEQGTAWAGSVPRGMVAARSVPDIPALHQLLRRAFQLSRSLPDALLGEFERTTTALPRITEAERLVVQRVGQDIFRRGLLDYWQGRCAVTGLAVPDLLQASHIKPWAVCTDSERLDVYNGLLLAPHLDAAFDTGFVTFADDGSIAISRALAPEAARIIGVHGAEAARLTPFHVAYMRWHREHVFRGELR